jgi:hypothetical protein
MDQGSREFLQKFYEITIVNYSRKKFYNIGHRPARILEDASEHDGGAATDGDPADQDLLLRRRRRQNPQQPGLAVPVGQRSGTNVIKLFVHNLQTFVTS